MGLAWGGVCSEDMHCKCKRSIRKHGPALGICNEGQTAVGTDPGVSHPASAYRCWQLLLSSLGQDVPMACPCRHTTSSSWYSSTFTMTLVFLSLDMRKIMVQTATSNSGLTPMKDVPRGFTRSFQLNCRFRTWSSSSGCRGQIMVSISITAVWSTFIILHSVGHT